MTNLDQKVNEQLKSDLAGLVRTARQYGYASEETRTYVQETVQQYDSQERKDEYLSLGATILLLMKRSSEADGVQTPAKE